MVVREGEDVDKVVKKGEGRGCERRCKVAWNKYYSLRPAIDDSFENV